MFELFESCDLFFLGTGGVDRVASASPRELLLLILCLQVVSQCKYSWDNLAIKSSGASIYVMYTFVKNFCRWHN